MNEAPASPGSDPSRGLHLDSWKEIAAYLKRDVRTVQRWEKHEGLPVHRHQHDERGTAYAYSAEIDRWLERRTRTGGALAPMANAEAATHTTPHRDAREPVHDRAHATVVGALQRKRRMALLWTTAGLAVAAATIAIWFSWPRSEASRPLSTLSIVFPPSEPFQEWGPDITLAPDGETLLYSPRGLFRLRRLDQLEARPIPGTENAWGPFFSPDGRSIAFFESGRLLRVATTGGAPVVVSDVGASFLGVGDWGRHDEIVYAIPTPDGAHGLYRVPASGGRPSLIATLGVDSDTYWLTPQWIRDGDVILATVARSSAEGTRFQAVTVSAATGEQKVLLEDARHAIDIGGTLVYWRDGALFAVRFDSRRLELTGPHVTAWENVGLRVRNRSWAIAGDTLIYWPTLRSARKLVWVDRAGREEALSAPAGAYSSPRLSPDGRRLAIIVERGSSELGDVWQHDLETGANLQLTRGNRSGAIAWSQDGATLIVPMRQGGANDLYRVRSDGTGEPELLWNRQTFLVGAFKKVLGWSRDGTVVVEQYGLNQPRFWKVPLSEGTPPRPFAEGARGRWRSGSLSADGQWLAFPSDESGRAEVYVAPVGEGPSRWRVSSNGGTLPVWGKTGRELFYWSGKRLMAVPVRTNGTFAPGEPRSLFEGDYYEVQPGSPNYDVSLDDQRFLLVRRGTPDGPERLNVIQGWRSEIERRLADAQ